MSGPRGSVIKSAANTFHTHISLPSLRNSRRSPCGWLCGVLLFAIRGVSITRWTFQVRHSHPTRHLAVCSQLRLCPGGCQLPPALVFFSQLLGIFTQSVLSYHKKYLTEGSGVCRFMKAYRSSLGSAGDNG